MSQARLPAVDRDFFAALGDVAFLNPFSAARAELIVKLAPEARLGDLTADREALARVVALKLGPLLREGAPALRRLSAEDRRLVEPAIFYVTYHRYVPQLDAQIERQA